jgi:hypothetical protein
MPREGFGAASLDGVALRTPQGWASASAARDDWRMAPKHPSEKPCVVCGRTITWRKAWERDWDQVKYCSKGCRGAGLGAADMALEASIIHLLDGRARSATICPSEAARAVAADQGLVDEQWRTLMEPARAAARRLVNQGQVVITQKGQVVDPSRAKGPIRIRRDHR